MVATVRLNSELEETLNSIAKRFHKKKSDVIREAITFYAKNLEKTKKTRLQKAVEKTYKEDFKEYEDMQESLDDSL
jgi:predicted DNA-binding protein